MSDLDGPERQSSTAPGAWDEFWSGKELVVIEENETHWRSVVWHRAFRFWEERFAGAPGNRFLECGAGSAQTSLYLAGRGFDCTMLDNSVPGTDMGRCNFRRAVSDSRSTWDIYENSIPPAEYVRILRQEGVEDAVARASSPYPDLSLPESMARVYGRMMLGSRRLWDRFESSPSRLAIAWSSTFRVYGTKNP